MDNEQIYQKLGAHPDAYTKIQTELTAMSITLDPPIADLAKADSRDLGRAMNELRRRAMRLQNNQKPASKRKGDDLMEWLSIAEEVLLKDEAKRAGYNEWLTRQTQTAPSDEPETSEPKEITLEDLILAGNYFLECDQPEKALQVVEIALERSPRNPDVWFLRGRTLIALEQYTTATKVFERLIDMKPEEAIYHYILGALYDDASSWNDALKQYREAEKLAPSVKYRAQIGQLLFRQFKRYDEAIALLQNCVKEDPENESYQNLLARACLDASTEHWTLVEQFGIKTRLVTERRQAVRTLASLKQVATLPALDTDIKEEIILRIADTEKTLRRSWPEHWWVAGGWVVALAGLLGIVQYFFLRSIGNGLYFLLGAGLYVVAGRTPQYILNRKPPADPLKTKTEANGCLAFFVVVGSLLFLPIAIAWNFLRNYIAAPLPQQQGRLVTGLTLTVFALIVLVGGGFLVNIGALAIVPTSSAAGQYAAADLKIAAPGSPLVGYVDGQGVEHITYISSDEHVHQLSLHGSGWADSDLSGSGHIALAGSPLDAYAHASTAHVNYLGSNHHVYELFFDGSHWSSNDLTAKAAAPAAASSSPLTGYLGSSGSEHVNYISADHHVHELFFDGSRWVDNDLIALSQGQNAASDSELIGYVGSDGSIHVNYVGSNRHVYELYFSGGWSDNDLSTLAGGQKAAAGSSLAGYWDHARSVHVFMTGVDNHLHELFFDSHSGHWSDDDLTMAGHSSTLVATHSAITAAFDSADNEYIDYIGSDQHLHQCYYSTSGWSDSDLTAQVKAIAPVAGSALATYLAPGEKARIAYINTSNHLSEIFSQ